MQWIQKHIDVFGGDPNRVTLGGLSAGAHSTNVQLQYELRHGSKEKPLFHNIIMVSNAISVSAQVQIVTDKSVLTPVPGSTQVSS